MRCRVRSGRPPEKKAPGDGNLRERKVNEKTERTIRYCRPPIKQLISHSSPIWLFKVVQGSREYYLVERGSLWWSFADRDQAERKFLRQVKKYSRQKGACLNKGAIHAGE